MGNSRVGLEVIQDSDALKYRNWPLVILSGIALAICVLLSNCIFFSYLSCLILCIFVIYIITVRPRMVFAYLAVLFACAANLAGAIAIELFPSFYLSELRCYSNFSGSLPMCVFGWWCLLCTLYLTDTNYNYSESGSKHLFSSRSLKALSFLNSAVCLLCAILFIRVLPHPSFVLGLDRFSYGAEYVQGIWGNLASYLSFLIVIPILSIKEKRSKIGIATIILYCLYLFWTGSKFGEFFTVACLVFIVYFDLLVCLSQIVLRRIVLLAIVICLAIVAFTGFAYSFTSSGSIADFYGSRTAQQGQIWWSVYQRSDQQIHVNDFLENELDALVDNRTISESVGEQHGIYMAMYLSAPTDVVNSKLATGSRYTEAGFACSYYYFGPLGVALFGIAMGLIIRVFVRGIIENLNRGELLSAILHVRFFSLARTALSMFLFSQFVTPLSIASFAYLFLCGLFRPVLKDSATTRKNRSVIKKCGAS